MLDHMTFRVTNISRPKRSLQRSPGTAGLQRMLRRQLRFKMLGLAYPDASEPDGKKADVWFIDGLRRMAVQPQHLVATSHGAQKIVRK